MKHKRLDRDKWGFQGFPYRQIRVDIDSFHGLVCFIDLTVGDYYFWDMPIAGKIAVCGGGMKWLQLVPDGEKHIITAKYLPDGSISVWYVDIIEGIEYAPDGVAVFIDKYLDVIFTPQGDYKLDDRAELDEALAGGDITPEQYDDAIREAADVTQELCSDLIRTRDWCNSILEYVMNKIAEE